MSLNIHFKTQSPLLIAGATGHIGSCMAFMNVLVGFSSHLILHGRSEEKLIGLREDLLDCAVEELKVDIITDLNELAPLPAPAYVVYTLSERFERQARREDMLEGNAALTKAFALAYKPYSKATKLMICVSNPADAMGFLLQNITGLAPENVCSFSALDTTRYRKHLAKAMKLPMHDMREVYTFGSHDDQMAVMQISSKVKGKTLRDWVRDGDLSAETLKAVEQAVIFGGRFIIKHRGYMTFESPAYLMMLMLMATIHGENAFTLPSSRLSEDPNYPGVFIAFKTIIDETGVHQQIEPLEGRDKEKVDIAYQHLCEQLKYLRHNGYIL